MSHYTPPISHSLPILPKVGHLPARQNVNRFGLDLHSTGNGAYVSPEVTPNTAQPHNHSHSMYGPSTPLQSVAQSPFVPRGYHSRGSPYSNGRDSVSYAAPGDVDPYYYPPVLASPPRGSANKKKIVKKADGKQPTFLTKLYAILETPEYNHIIRWDDEGSLIIIEKPEDLSKKILPLVYRQSRFASFSRQLNIYGWMRKMSLRHVEKGIVDPDASTWSHGTLNRESTRDELVNFKRRVPPRPSQAARGPQRDMPEMDYGSDAYSSPDAYHSHLFEEQYHHHNNPFWQHQQTLPQVQSFHALPPPLINSPFLITDRNRPAPISIGQSTPKPTGHGTGSAPQTAPLGSMTQTPVTRGHNRTRSYQCNSPLNPNPLFTDVPLQGYHSPLSQSLGNNDNNGGSGNGNGHDAIQVRDNTKPTYNPIDPSTWARRGFTDFDGNPMPNVSSSVPTNFGSSHPQSNYRWTPSPPDHFQASLSGSSPSTPSMAGTVSPAIFQQGYTPPTSSAGLNMPGPVSGNSNSYGADVPMPMPHSMNMSMNMGMGMGMGTGMGMNMGMGMGMGHQRQTSHPNPSLLANQHQRSNAGHSRTLSLGEPISLITGDHSFDMNSDSRFPTTSTRSDEMDLDIALDKKMPLRADDTLPSAALRGFSTKMPFEGMLAEHDEPMVMS